MKKKVSLIVFLLLFTLFALTACQKEPVTLYQIGFETNGGSAMDNLVLEAGAKLTMPAEPQKEGQTFAGWYLDEGLTEPFTVPETMPAESFWLFADWEVTLTFDSQGGDAVEPVKGEAGTILGDLPTVSYDDNLFLGWYLDKDYTERLGLVMPDANTTVYARWQALESTTVLDITDSIQINGSDCYEMEAVDGGYKVTAKEGKGEWDYFYFTIDFNVKEYSTFEIIVEGKEGTSYMTKVEQGGVTSLEEARTLSGEEEVIYWTVDESNLTETGGEKLIIFLNQGAKGANADAPEYITVKSIKLYRGKDLDAEEKQVIFFNTNGGSSVSPLFAAEGEVITAPEDPEKAGYAFTGWYSDADCTTAFAFTTMPAGPTAVYAGWEESENITIGFETNGGEAVPSIETTVGSPVETLPTTSQDGKLFVGWYADEAFTQPFTAVTYDSSMTLYAYFIDPTTDLNDLNPTSFITGWEENEAGTMTITYENDVMKIVTTEAKGEWSYIKTMIGEVGSDEKILKVTVTGTEGQKMMIKLRGVSGRDYEYSIVFTGSEQTEYFALSEAVMFDFNALIFVDGGTSGADVSGTEAVISELALYQIGPDIDLSNYELLDWQPTLGYWFSKDGASPDKLLTSQKLYVSSGVRFSKEDLPNGTIIIIENGYQYRPDGWTSETENTADRPGNVTTYMVVVDDAWWGEYVLRGFNVSKIASQDMSAVVEETGEMLKIYVPKE